MGVIADAGRNGFRMTEEHEENLRALEEWVRARAAGLGQPLVNVRAKGDVGHEDGCARDHLIPGVCVPGPGVVTLTREEVGLEPLGPTRLIASANEEDR